MCNACGFMCCAHDAFEGCGCDHCDCEDCWSDDALYFEGGGDQDDIFVYGPEAERPAETPTGAARSDANPIPAGEGE